EQWILLYIERWLKAPFQMETGEIISRTAGTPQVISSLSNETYVRLRAKAPDKVGYVQVQKFSWTPSESRRMASPGKKKRAQLICTLGPLGETPLGYSTGRSADQLMISLLPDYVKHSILWDRINGLPNRREGEFRSYDTN
ncbi:hypothetical protein REC12_22545, partial [Desulfosporosinus sp. PR]|nr:hypothetical protein [Desulfosporosinus sp. PR]